MPSKPDRMPALDPTAPGIYRRIIETAEALRVAQRADIEVKYTTLRVLQRIRLQAAAEIADAKLEHEARRREALSEKAKTIYRHRVVRWAKSHPLFRKPSSPCRLPITPASAPPASLALAAPWCHRAPANPPTQHAPTCASTISNTTQRLSAPSSPPCACASLWR